jgi:prepilin-type processing-associated H-X9-DG protein
VNALYAQGAGDNRESPGVNPTSLAKIEESATTVWCADGNYANDPWIYSWHPTWGYPGVDTSKTPREFNSTGGDGNATEGALVERHLETTNILWCDGHVKAMKLDALVAKKCSPGDGCYSYFTIQSD